MDSTAVGAMTGVARSRAVGWPCFAAVALATIVAAIVANVAVYYAGRAIIGYDPQFAILADVSTTIFFTAIPAIGAVLLYDGLLRFARRPARTFAMIAALVYVVTTILDFTSIPSAPGATAGQAVTLVLTHTAAALVITSFLLRLAPARR